MPSIEVLWSYSTCILLASFGGLARILSISTEQTVTRKLVLKEVVLSSFTGSIVLLVCLGAEIQTVWVGAICGISGYVGIRIFDTVVPAIPTIIPTILKRLTGLKMDHTDESKKGE